MEQAVAPEVVHRQSAGQELRLADLVLTVGLTLGASAAILAGFAVVVQGLRPLVQPHRQIVVLLVGLGIYLGFGGAIAVTLRRFPHPARMLGLRLPSPNQALLVVLGLVPWFGAEALVAAVSALAFNGGRPLPTNTRDLFFGQPHGAGTFLLAIAVAAVAAPVCEEVFFRGMVYRFMKSRWPLRAAVVGSALLFGLAHFNGRAGSLMLLPVFTFMGIILALLYERTGSLGPSILLHGLNNAVLTIVVFVNG